MGTLIVVDCEAPFGVGAPSVGDMTEFGAVDVTALRDGRVETFCRGAWRFLREQRMAVKRRKRPCVPTSDGCFPTTASVCIT
jgi:hypothetical protein